jgi:hypothetical protein
MILSAIAEKLKRRSKDDFKGRHFQASLILQAVCWYLRYSLSYRDIEELFLERGLEVDHSTLNRWVLAYAPLIERRLRAFRKPHCGSIRIDETYIKRHRSLIAVWVVKPSVQRLSGDECPGRVMVLSAVGVSRRMMVSEAPAS